MDSELQILLDQAGDFFNLDGATLLALLAIISIVSRLIGKLIPDDKTGVLGVLRSIFKILGLYASNRITSTASTETVVKGVLAKVKR